MSTAWDFADIELIRSYRVLIGLGKRLADDCLALKFVGDLMSFDYGDVVIVTANAPSKFLKFGNLGSVCAIDKNVRSERAIAFGVQKGATIYLVEFASGQAIEVPELYLTPG
jgi:hypothetical protein